MGKNTIFGEENFIIKGMITEINNKIDNIIIDNITNTARYMLPEIQINHEKVRRWVMLCSRLENIEETELIDIATKKKIADLKDELDQQKAMWNELKEHISNQIIHYDELSDKFKEENNNGCVLLANSKRSMIEEILYKMQELEKGEKDVED